MVLLFWVGSFSPQKSRGRPPLLGVGAPGGEVRRSGLPKHRGDVDTCRGCLGAVGVAEKPTGARGPTERSERNAYYSEDTLCSHPLYQAPRF